MSHNKAIVIQQSCITTKLWWQLLLRATLARQSCIRRKQRQWLLTSYDTGELYQNKAVAVVAILKTIVTQESCIGTKWQQLYLSKGKTVTHTGLFKIQKEEILVVSYSMLVIIWEGARVRKFIMSAADPLYQQRLHMVQCVTLHTNIPIVDYHSHMNIV